MWSFEGLGQLAEVGPGDHLCWLYADDEEHRALLAPFLRRGLEQNEQVLYIYALHPPQQVVGYLEEEGLAVEPYLASGQLALLSADAPSVRAGLLNPDGVVPFLEQATTRALEQGYRSLRITIEMTASPARRPVESEAVADTLFPGIHCLLLCQYDRRHFDATALLDVLVAHPIVVVEGEPYPNLYHLPATGRPVADPAAATLHHWLSNLAARKRVDNALDTQEKQLQESDRLLKKLFDFGPDGTVLVDQEGCILRASHRVEVMFGYAQQELVGQPIEILIPERFQEQHKQYRVAFERRPQPRPMGTELELYGRRKDGREFPVDVMLNPLEAEDDRLTVAVIRDITQRKQEQQALRESALRFRTIFENAAMGISLVDVQGHLVAANPVFRDMLGYRQDEIRGLPITEITHPEDREETQRTFEALMSGRQARTDLEKRYLHRDGRVVWAREAASCIRDAEGRPQFSLGMVEDITERKHTEAELARVRHRLAQSREEERRYLAQELHDGPVQDLHGIDFQLSLLANTLQNEEQARELAELQEMVHHTIQTLRTTCQDLRPPTLAPFGLEAAIRSRAENFQQAHPEIALELDLMTDGQTLPEHVRLALYRVYEQALHNVVQHAGARRVRVTFRLEAERVVLEVEDDGRGFEVPRHWFELARGGHLGLVGAAERAEMTGGRLDVRSAPGQGTTLSVIVPRNEEG
jgi:PAS domain S-box-containing protein